MLKKSYNKSGKSCRVTFELPAEANAQVVTVCGEFNDWDQTAHPMKQRKNGSFSTTVSLKVGRQYRFRYFVDGQRWENDWNADAYLPNSFGDNDSVVNVPAA